MFSSACVDICVCMRRPRYMCMSVSRYSSVEYFMKTNTRFMNIVWSYIVTNVSKY